MKLTNIELRDICPLAKAGKPFEVVQEDACENCKYFCRIHYEVDPQHEEKQVHFWMNEDIVSFLWTPKPQMENAPHLQNGVQLKPVV